MCFVSGNRVRVAEHFPPPCECLKKELVSEKIRKARRVRENEGEGNERNRLERKYVNGKECVILSVEWRLREVARPNLCQRGSRVQINGTRSPSVVLCLSVTRSCHKAGSHARARARVCNFFVFFFFHILV